MDLDLEVGRRTELLNGRGLYEIVLGGVLDWSSSFIKRGLANELRGRDTQTAAMLIRAWGRLVRRNLIVSLQKKRRGNFNQLALSGMTMHNGFHWTWCSVPYVRGEVLRVHGRVLFLNMDNNNVS